MAGAECQWGVAGSGAWQTQQRRRPTPLRREPPAPDAHGRHSLAYRAFFALPAENFTTATGQPTNAIYGFASMLANTLRDEAPTHFAVAFDVSRKTWRSEEFTEYKANRSKTPDEFKARSS